MQVVDQEGAQLAHPQAAREHGLHDGPVPGGRARLEHGPLLLHRQRHRQLEAGLLRGWDAVMSCSPDP